MAAAGAIELAFVGALLGGLATRMVKELPQTLTMIDVQPQQPPPQEPPPPQPDLVKPEVPEIPIPQIQIQRDQPQKAITAVATPTPVAAPPKPAEPAPASAVQSTPLGSATSTHTTPPYPEMARRLSQSGQVQLHITVGPDGHVTSVSVVQSSGSNVLDDAAKSWVQRNWRYKPATQNGTAIAAETNAVVVFDLKNAR